MEVGIRVRPESMDISSYLSAMLRPTHDGADQQACVALCDLALLPENAAAMAQVRFNGVCVWFSCALQCVLISMLA